MSVRVGTLAIDDGAQVFYAKDRQFFSRTGIDVDIRPMPNGPEIAAAAAVGDIDVGFSNLFALAAAFTRGAQLRLIAPGQLFYAGEQSLAIIVRTDSPYRTGKDLDGKKIGVRVSNSLVGVGAKAWVDQHGGDSNTIQLVHLPGERHAEALEQGEVDAVSTSLTDVPVPKRGTKRIIGYPTDAIAPRFIGAGWYARADWIEAHRDVARRYAEAIVRAGQWANAHPTESGQILMKYTHLTPEGLGALGEHRVRYGEVLDPALIDPLIAVAARYNVIPKVFPARDLVATNLDP
ncbi:MAG TPA: ABC transporter substrate-binding protein [bacterium]|nr:ABC transporter substrate-binding protein [bacterium]